MLTKQTGASVVVATTASSVQVSLSNYDGSTVRKVRIAVDSYPALVGINTGTNLSGAGILMPTGTVEHFNLEGNTHVHIVRYGTNNGIASITPVA